MSEKEEELWLILCLFQNFIQHNFKFNFFQIFFQIFQTQVFLLLSEFEKQNEVKDGYLLTP